MEPLRVALEKVCFQRKWQMELFVPRDGRGNEIPLQTLLGSIPSSEITFTRRNADEAAKSMIPPLIEDVMRQLKLEGKGKTPRTGTGIRASVSESQVITLRTFEGSIDDSNASGQSEAKEVVDVKKEKTIRQQYRFFETPIGVGAFSQVFRAVNKDTGEEVAIKVIEKLEEEDEDDADLRAKFLQEISVMRQIHHEYVVKLIEFSENADTYFVVMEMMGGDELFTQIIEREQYPEDEASVLICQVLNALKYLHEKQIVHRDLKPENLLFSDKTYKTLKLADFGESTIIENQSLNTYCGTPDYMAPEIIKGLSYSTEVDMWSLGVISYVIMAGFPPFDGENDAEVLASIVSVNYSFPSPEWDDYSEEAKDFIKCLLIEDTKARMTAKQALDHPFIKKYNTDAQRNVKGHQVSPAKSMDSAILKPDPSPKGKPRRSNSDNMLGDATLRASLSGGNSPRVDPQDLAFLQQQLNPQDDSSKQLLLKGVDIVLSLVPKNSSREVLFVGELANMKVLIDALPNSGAKRTQFEELVMTQFWKRLSVMKVYILTRKEKSKRGRK
eukprot:TRINITY_DN5451_c0_g1_i3.p1 TRINITY_DN5451_c0_g1~~TRINITY_DN5451_c0_g1_i3.p1  ORF type:complete len:556 (-),score=102.81 TRINITY_DN5451_c0_g1_i3:123-1790(-)